MNDLQNALKPKCNGHKFDSRQCIHFRFLFDEYKKHISGTKKKWDGYIVS